MKNNYEIADILGLYGNTFLGCNSLPDYKISVLRDIEKCRTSYFGGHKFECDDCGHTHIRYNSCGNRHCPKCQYLDRERWVQNREADLLPVKYFHVVFTVPHLLNDLFLNNQKEMYSLLFTTAWSVLKSFAKDEKHLGALTAMIAVLHTWGQNLSYHPHLHCIVPAGGITKDGQWKETKTKGKFLYPVRAISVVFRARLIQNIQKLAREKQLNLPKTLIDSLYSTPWVVYARRPFKNVNTVIKYLGRYTHKIAISNQRILDIADGKISFTSKNYRKNGKLEVVKLNANEFIRRFCMHISPKGFRKIRYYGFLAGKKKKEYLAQIRAYFNVAAPIVPKLNMRTILEEKLGHKLDLCPVCKKGQMTLIEVIEDEKKYNQLE